MKGIAADLNSVSNVRVPAPVLLIASGFTQYVGAGFAVALFALMPPASVAWWRFAIAGVILLIWRRPWRLKLALRELVASGVFGVVMAGMNIVFYEAISRLDLGVAVSLEFIGPVVVAILTRRTLATVAGSACALAGVVLISGWGVDTTDPRVAVGVALAIFAGCLWAGYIILGQRIASRRSGISSLAIGCAVAAVVYAPLAQLPLWPIPEGVEGAGWVSADTSTWALAGMLLLVGVLSTVIPYSFEQMALARADAATFALLTSLLPATSLLAGAVMLGQRPAGAAIVGLVLVSVAVGMSSSGQCRS